MLTGLTLMQDDELARLLQQLGKNPTPASEDKKETIMAWLKQAVDCKADQPESVERAVFDWTASRLDIDYHPTLPTDDLERLLRLRIATEAGHYLTPHWQVACAFIAQGPEPLIEAKMQMLRHAAHRAVPSRSALQEKEQEWQQLIKKLKRPDSETEIALIVEALRARGNDAREALTLGLIVALADGRISFEEEKLLRMFSEGLEMPREVANDILSRVNDLFWRYQNELTPTQAGGTKSASLATEAARRTLAESGVDGVLSDDARLHLLGQFVPEAPTETSAWSKLAAGFSGLSSFFSSRLKDEDHAKVADIVYRCVLHQHKAVSKADEEANRQAREEARRQAEIEARAKAREEALAAQRSQAQEREPAQIEGLGKGVAKPLEVTVIETAKKPTRKSISLEP